MTTKNMNYTTAYIGNLLSISDFKLSQFHSVENSLNFTEEPKLWQFLILKSCEEKFFYLQDLSMYLLKNDKIVIDSYMTEYALLNGYKIHQALKTMKSLENELNNTMQSFYFDEKVVIKNNPIENINKLLLTIIEKTEPNLLNELLEKYKKSNIDFSDFINFNKPKMKM